MAGLVLGGVLTALTLTGCTSPPATTATPTPEATSAAPTTATASATPSASVSASPSPSEPVPSAVPVTIDITIAGGQVTPNGEKIDVEVGQPIVLNVTSDEDDEVHAHTDGDGFELEVTAGDPATGEFTINSPGSYEVESHHLGKTIVILNAR